MDNSDKSVLRLILIQLHDIRKNYINGLGIDLLMIGAIENGIKSVLKNNG